MTAINTPQQPQPGPYYYPQPMPAYYPPPAQPSNWAGITSLSIAIPAAVFAFVPVFCVLTAVLLGVPATVFGGIAVHRARTGKATSMEMAGWGLGLGIWSVIGWLPFWTAVTLIGIAMR